MAKPKTIRMRFSEDKFYHDRENPIYKKGIIYDVPIETSPRWINRGGELVDEDPVESPAKVEEPDTSGAEILSDDASEAEETLEAKDKKEDDSKEAKTLRDEWRTRNTKKAKFHGR